VETIDNFARTLPNTASPLSRSPRPLDIKRRVSIDDRSVILICAQMGIKSLQTALLWLDWLSQHLNAISRSADSIDVRSDTYCVVMNTPEACKETTEIRAEIDRLDRQVIGLIGENDLGERLVDKPRGTGFTASVVSPLASMYAYNPEIDDSLRAIVRADTPDSRSEIRTTVRSPRC
jgi:hypothetical protein